jgi:hypothetical protein
VNCKGTLALARAPIVRNGSAAAAPFLGRNPNEHLLQRQNALEHGTAQPRAALFSLPNPLRGAIDGEPPFAICRIFMIASSSFLGRQWHESAPIYGDMRTTPFFMMTTAIDVSLTRGSRALHL